MPRTINTSSNAGITLTSGDSPVTITSSGTIDASAGAYGLLGPSNAYTITNSGLVRNTAAGGIGIGLAAGGAITNQSGSYIFGKAIGVKAAGIDVNNYGTIKGLGYPSTGVSLTGGGSVTNQSGALLYGLGKALYATGAAATLVNSGNVNGASGYGVKLTKGGVIENLAGDIFGHLGGVVISGGAGTVINLGTIYGVSFAAGYTNLLELAPGAGFSAQAADGGNTIGAGNTSTLMLMPGTSTGRLNNFADFGAITFASDASWSLTGGTSAFAGGEVFSGFNAGDTISMFGVTNETIAGFANNTLSLTGDASLNLIIQGAFSADSFALYNGASSVTITLCFAEGTRILTPSGEVPVEALAIGDRVMTQSGVARPICWIGAGCVLATRGRRNAATPVIVRKGALADNVPNRDLRITKGHALYLDNVLIPVEELINHRSILWDDRAQEVTVYHVELETHDVLLANGAAAESYRDDGNRWLFHNANSGWELPPQESCAPLLTDGPLVHAIWRRLLDRSGAGPSLFTTDDPDLHLRVDGVRVDGRVVGGVYAFRLPPSTRTVSIVSRSGVPAELGVARDHRNLGIAVRQVRLWQGAQLTVVDASDPCLTDGFHEFEADNGWRWTDGKANLPAALLAKIERSCDLELEIGCVATYQSFGEDRPRAVAW